MIKYKPALLTFLCVVAYLLAFAQQETDNVVTTRLLSIKDGLPSRDVKCMVQDKEGYIWVGTEKGLTRYDGHTFKLYNHKSFGLRCDSIEKLAIDNQNNLIIQYPKSLNPSLSFEVLDLNTNKLQSLNTIFKSTPLDLSHLCLIANDETGNLNILTAKPYCWYTYNSSKGLVKQFQFDGLIDGLAAIESDYLSIYYGSHFTGSSAFISIHSLANTFPSFEQLFVLNKDSNSSGIKVSKFKLIFDYENASILKAFEQFAKSDKFNNHKYSNFSLDNLRLNEVENHFTRFSYIDNDLAYCFYDVDKGVFQSINNQLVQLIDKDLLKGSREFFINQAYVDNLGNKWFCSTQGLFETSIKKKYFKKYFTNSPRINLPPNAGQLRGICEIKKGNNTYLFANESSNLWMLNQQTQEEKALPYNDKMSYAMLSDGNNLYLGSDNLYKYNITTYKCKSLLPISNFNDVIWSIYPLSGTKFLLGKEKSGLFLFNERTQSSMPLSFLSNTIPPMGCVYKIYDSKIKGLIAVAENGIYCIDNQLRITDYYGSMAKDASHRLPIKGIYDMHEDKNGLCWLATNGEGLVKWNWNKPIDKSANLIQYLSIDYGLPSPILYRIEEDKDANLWIGSYQGLIRFNTMSKGVSIFTTNDGLPSDEFNRISSYKATDGRMYFGGINGLVSFNPIELNQYIDSIKVPLVITSLTKFSANDNKLVDCLSSYKQDPKMIFEVGDKFLSINFSLLDYKQRIHHFAYKIEGFEKEWNYTEEGIVRVSGLPSGKYILKIKAQLENGQWNKNEIILPLTILKPFYFQIWFVIFSALSFILFAVTFYFYKIRKVEKQQVMLENKVIYRTKELNQALTENKLLLAEIHHRVKNNLQIISGLLFLQGNSSDDENIKRAFAESQSRVNSIALIHQKLYQNATFGSISFHVFLKELVGKVAELFEQENQAILFEIGNEELLLDINTAVPLGLMVNELVTNAYKYLPKRGNGNIVSIHLTREINEEYLLHYKDNGPGLKEGLDFESSQTLGMELIRGLADQLGGSVTYAYQEGSCFDIKFKNKLN